MEWSAAVVTKEDALIELRALQKSGDTEAAHEEADAIITDFLIELGHDNIVVEWMKVPKWYA